MSELENVLAHYGVKGMKWGQRHDKGHEGETVKTKQLAKLDKKFEKHATSTAMWVQMHNAGAEAMNSHQIHRINNKPEYKNADFTHDSPLRQKYYAEHQKVFVDEVVKASKSVGFNPSGTKKFVVRPTEDGDWAFGLEDVKHAEGETIIKVFYDKTGHILKLEPQEPLAHSDLDEVLEHYGVKGMHWGQRKTTSSAPKKKPSVDARAAMKAREKAKVGGKQALSNKELKLLVARMNLEKQYSTLNPTPSKAASKFVTDMLVNHGKQQLNKATGDIVAKQIAKTIAGLAAASAGRQAAKHITRLAIGA